MMIVALKDSLHRNRCFGQDKMQGKSGHTSKGWMPLPDSRPHGRTPRSGTWVRTRVCLSWWKYSW